MGGTVSGEPQQERLNRIQILNRAFTLIFNQKNNARK